MSGRDISHDYGREMGTAWTFLLHQRKRGTANEKWGFEGHFSFSNNVQQRDISRGTLIKAKRIKFSRVSMRV